MNCNLGLKNYLDSLNLGPRSKNEKKNLEIVQYIANYKMF